MTKNDIAEILKGSRLESKLTQAQVAQQINRPQQTIAAWETGRAQPDANTLFELFKLYGKSIDAAFGFSAVHEVSNSEYVHIKKYRSLNENGKKKVDEYIEDLLCTGTYNNINESSTTLPLVARKGKPITKEGITFAKDAIKKYSDSIDQAEINKK